MLTAIGVRHLAVGCAYARATGTNPRSFPINFDVDFDPFPR